MRKRVFFPFPHQNLKEMTHKLLYVGHKIGVRAVLQADGTKSILHIEYTAAILVRAGVVGCQGLSDRLRTHLFGDLPDSHDLAEQRTPVCRSSSLWEIVARRCCASTGAATGTGRQELRAGREAGLPFFGNTLWVRRAGRSGRNSEV
jgi:hypothetical protein